MKNNSKKLLIGVSGFARSGKDTFSSLVKSEFLKTGKNVKIFSFAFALKRDIDGFCSTKIGISALTEDSALKSIIRPILISYGQIQRHLSNGKYWIDILKPEVDAFFEGGGDIAIISDLRFKEFTFDEYDFIRSFENNLIFNISRNREDGSLVPAAHETEEKSSDFFIRNCDHAINWNTSPDQIYLKSKMLPSIELINSKL